MFYTQFIFSNFCGISIFCEQQHCRVNPCLTSLMFLGNLCQKIPFRVWIACMVFLSTYINYTTRVNMSIAIVSMAGGGKETKQPECLIDEDSETNRTQTGNVTSTQRTLPDVSVNWLFIYLFDHIFWYKTSTTCD